MRNRLVPRLRFKEFNNEWRTLRADEIFLNISKKNMEKYPILSVTQNKGLVYRNELNSDIKYDRKSLSSYKLVKPNNIIISLRSFQGGFELSNKVGIVSPAYNVLQYKYDQWSPYFWKIYFKSYNFIQLLKKVTYGIRDGRSISFNDFSSLKLNFTDYKEQQKIGQFFSKLDRLIDLQSQKLSHLKQLKKGYLQKMFPRKEKSIPNIRFLDFYSKNKKVTLNELIRKNNHKNKNLEVTNVESVSNIDGFIKQTNQFNDYSVASKNLSNYYIIHPKDFAYNPSRINVGSIAYKETDDNLSVVSPLYVSFSTNKYVYDKFLFYWFSTNEFKSQRQMLSEGGVRDTLSYNQLIQMRISLPYKSEQSKIMNFLNNLNNLIIISKDELNSWKSLKKAYLQKMFC